jgi:hypothetical protein
MGTLLWRRLWSIVLAVLLAAVSAYAADGTTVVRDAWARYRSVKTEQEDMEFLIVAAPSQARFSRSDADALLREPRGGVIHKRAVRQVQYAEDGHDKIHLLFALPAEDAGTGFLFWRQPGKAQDDQWVFLPGRPAARRISASSTQSFMGTDLIYEDVREFAGERTERFAYERMNDEAVDERACDVVVATPQAETTTAYRRRKMWFDKERLVPLQVEFYDPAGKLQKVLHNADIHEVAPGVRRADFTEVRDLHLNETTLIVTTKRSVGIVIPSQVFTEDHLVHAAGD